MLTTPVPAGTKLAGISNAFGEEVQSSRLVMGETGDTAVSPDAPLPTADAAVLAAILAGVGAFPEGAATDATLQAISALLAGTLTVGLPTGAASSAKQDAASTLLTAIATALAGTLAVSANALPLPTGAATQATLASLLAKTIAAPATEAKQDASVTVLGQIVTALAATLKVQTPIPAGVVAGQAVVTTTATALPAAALVNGIVVKASASNTTTIFIGGSGVTLSANGYPLAPGEAMSFAVANASALYLISSAAGVAYFGGN